MIRECFDGYEFELETEEGIFSPSAIDTGTKAMLSFTELCPEDRVLDLGCGCGIVGIWAAKRIGADRVVQCDISETAVRVTRENAVRNGVPGTTALVSDGLKDLPEGEFTLILSNPPYHTDFSVAKSFIEDGFKRLRINGRMIMVTKRLDWYKNKLTSVFGGVKVREKDCYYIFIAEKRSLTGSRKSVKNTSNMSKKLARKYKAGREE